MPVFKYLESQDIDEVGYTLRTASLMTDPEYFFDDTDISDYRLFGVRYLIVPKGMAPPVPAHHVLCSGSYCLWSLPDSGYFHMYDTTGVLAATRADVGTRSVTLLDSPLLEEGARPDGGLQRRARRRPPPRRDVNALPWPARSHRASSDADLANGQAHAVVRANRRATVVLSASYDPGWHDDC